MCSPGVILLSLAYMKLYFVNIIPRIPVSQYSAGEAPPVCEPFGGIKAHTRCNDQMGVLIVVGVTTAEPCLLVENNGHDGFVKCPGETQGAGR